MPSHLHFTPAILRHIHRFIIVWCRPCVVLRSYYCSVPHQSQLSGYGRQS